MGLPVALSHEIEAVLLLLLGLLPCVEVLGTFLYPLKLGELIVAAFITVPD